MKKCPIWDHECYGSECVAWTESTDCCRIISAMEFGAYSMKIESLKPMEIRY